MGQILRRCRQALEWLDVVFMPFGGWPVMAGVAASIATFIWRLILNWGPATVPAVIIALGAGAVAIDAITSVVRKWRVRWSSKRKTALAIYNAYLDGQHILARLRRADELSLDEAWNCVKEWNSQVNEAVRDAPAHETAGLWTINMPSAAHASFPSLEGFVRTKNEGKLRKVMLRAIESTKLRGSEIFEDSLPPGNDHSDGGAYDIDSAMADLMILRTKMAQHRIEAASATNIDTIRELGQKQITLRKKIREVIRLGVSHAEAEAFMTIGNLSYQFQKAVNDEHRLLVCIAARDLDYLDDLKDRYASYLGKSNDEKA